MSFDLHTPTAEILAKISEDLTRIADVLEGATKERVRNKPSTSPNSEGIWDFGPTFGNDRDPEDPNG